MAIVTFDDRSFLVGGNRIWLVSGSVHYFRTPAALWPDRLLKAKRAGLNCISTYMAWNFHEPLEGQWELTGDQDIASFVRMAGDMGLYVILRPGPYICAEWDFGGLPAWLTAKQGISFRTNNAAYTHYYDKYLAKVLPRLAELQVSRGGNIIAIQNENEYFMTTVPDRMEYLEFINRLFQRSGFDVPIINCNLFSDPPVPDNIECVNGYDRVVRDLKRMRLRQGDAPLLVTEFWCGWYDRWGGEHQMRSAADVARKALECLGCGAQYNYYMWHGGTNFGFWGGHQGPTGDTYQTTSYDFDAPLAEGGGLTEKYYFTRLVNMLARHMGRFFAASKMDPPGVSIHEQASVMNISGSLGRWAIVTSGGQNDLESARISLPDGTTLTVPLQPLGATAVPVGLVLSVQHTLDYANLMPLGFFGRKILVLHAPAGWAGRLSINGEEIQCKVPAGKEPQIIEHQELLVVIVNSDLAMRTWLVDETLLFGPDYVGETLEDVKCRPGTKQYTLLTFDGQVKHKKLKAAPAKKPPTPKLSPWERIAVCTEPVSDKLQWRKIDRPRDVDRLGLHYGYVWYRLQIEQERARSRRLFFPDCEDRATVYLNGDLVGVWGRGPNATRSPMPANFKRGTNVLTLLVDNLGRRNFGARLGELKGLFGHVYDAKCLRTVRFKLKPSEGFSRRIVPRQLGYLAKTLEKLPMWEATADIQLSKVVPIHLSFSHLPCHLAVLCNDRVAGFFPGTEDNCGDVTLGAELKVRKNQIKLLLWGQVQADDLQHLQLHMLNEPVSAKAKWSVRPWKLPEPGGLIVGKDRPAWYAASFKYAGGDNPLFIHIIGAKKGQVFLNGHNIGRFWNVGPQQYYYLPECWLADKNELLLFEEQGNIPRRSSLEFRPLGPYQ